MAFSTISRTLGVADFDHIYRSTLIGSICSRLDRKVLFCASDGRELLAEQQAHPAEVVIVELYLPVISGFEVIRLLKKAHVPGKILAISSIYQPEMVLQLKDAGADGYCSKHVDDVEQALNVLYRGEQFFDPDYYAGWAKATDSFLMQHTNAKDEAPEFKTVEIKIMQLTCEGKSNKEIGEALNLSKRTIDTYTRDLLLKLNLKTKIELVNYAMHNGLCRLTCHNSEAGFCTCKTLFVK